MKKAISCSALILLLASLAVGGCSKADKRNAETARPDVETKASDVAAEPEMVTTESGLRYIDLVVGEGQGAANDMNVTVHYTLWLDENGEKGKLVQSSKDGNRPFSFTVGQRGLIPGWNEGMLGMKQGGTRRLYIPSAIGYGPRGNPPDIPSNADLIFEIELLQIG